MPLINLTKHDVNILTTDRMIRTIKPSGTLCRVQEKLDPTPVEIEGVLIFKQGYKNIINAPVFNENQVSGSDDFLNYYIVSSLVKYSMPYRGDLIVPTRLIYDGVNNVIACRAFLR